MSTPAPFYFQHHYNPVKGWPTQNPVDCDALLSSNVTGNVYSGRIVHKNGSGQFELGAISTQMPIMLIPSGNDPDVTNPSPGGGTQPNDWYAVNPSGKMSGLVAIGGFEVETSEFDTSDTGITYNDLLHAPVEAQFSGSTANAGMLYKHRNWPGGSTAAIVLNTDNICGVVSHPATTNAMQVTTIGLWLWYFPGGSTA